MTSFKKYRTCLAEPKETGDAKLGNKPKRTYMSKGSHPHVLAAITQGPLWRPDARKQCHPTSPGMFASGAMRPGDLSPLETPQNNELTFANTPTPTNPAPMTSRIKAACCGGKPYEPKSYQGKLALRCQSGTMHENNRHKEIS